MLKKTLHIGLIAGMSLLFSCKDFSEMNTDPNRATTTHPQLQLTKIEWEAFRDFGGTTPLYATKMLVQTDGENTAQYYKWGRGDFSAYGRLRDITKMNEEAIRIGVPSYSALAKFFRAYYFYNLTLTFGDVPYTQALQAESATEPYFAPVYDDQKTVLKGVLKELEEANDILSKENTIINGDIIYSGSVAQWRKLVNSFRLKVLLSLSKRTGEADLNIVSSFKNIYQTQPLLSGTIDNGQLVFRDQQDNRYPEFNSSGFGSGMYMDSTFIKLLQDKKDPRLFIFCTQTKLGKEAGKPESDFTSYEGGDPATPYAQVNLKAAAGKTSKVKERYYQDPTTEPRVLVSYAEQQLILAEAAVRGWIDGNAGSFFNQGVKGSFKFYETYAKGLNAYVSEDAANLYLSFAENNFANATTDEERIEMIITEKYIESFFQNGWTAFREHLRTGYPAFRRPSGVAIPFRWIYPQSEYNFNAKNVGAAIKTQFGEGNDEINKATWWVK